MTDHIEDLIAQWRRERPDVDPTPMAIVGRIQRTTQALRPRLDAGHQRFGLTGEAFDVLASLRRAGAPFELSPTDLYKRLMLSSGAMTNRLDRLEAEGLVERRPDPSDRRGVIVHLSEKGRDLIDRALVRHVENERELLSALNDQELEQLSTLLRKLLTHLEPNSAQ